MNSVYLNDYIDSFEKVLSFAHEVKYSLSSLEKAISNSSYFQNIEKDSNGLSPIITDNLLLKSVFPEFFDITFGDIKSYSQTYWAAEAYLRIQGATRLTFEAIFIYIPIEKMYRYYHLYHEMDFSSIIDEFNRLYKERSVLDVLIKKYKLSMSDICKDNDISYSLLVALKSRKRDIKNASVSLVSKLANIFRVRIETIAEFII